MGVNWTNYLLIFILFLACKKEKENIVIKKEISLDGIANVPEWLKLNVEETFTSEGLNVWVPTNNFQSSSLIKVPRFPRKFTNKELQEKESLKDFIIIPIQSGKTQNISGVRNEQISLQIAVGAKVNVSDLKVRINDFLGVNSTIFSSENIKVRFPKYMPIQRGRSEYVWSPKMEDILGEGVSGTAYPNVVADPLLELESVNVPAYRAQPIWLTFKIPKNSVPGVYEGDIILISSEFEKFTVKVKLNILDIQINSPKDYKFHLDLWVNPSAIAEYYHLEHWSDEHWAMISKYLEEYASRGGKTITTTITHEPWHKPWLNNSTISQSFFGYKSMIGWSKGKNGNWKFDYSIFDKYIKVASNLNISGAINAFSMTPFLTKQKIHYFDEKEGKYKVIELDIKDKLYTVIWTKFLVSFKEHLYKKGLFERTYLGFDEKPDEVLKHLKTIIAKAAPEFLNKIVIAGHPEATDLAQNLSISYMFFPNQPLENKAVIPVLPTINNRIKENKTTTFYLCAEPDHPNTLTYSPAVEAQMIPWLVLKYNTDGYLRWAYNNWTKDPYTEPVFIHNQGDDYYVYPGEEGPISSIRWELLKEGIEDYELFNIVKNEGNISNDSLQKAIELATRNQDGRYKEVEDILNARKMILINY